MTTTVAEPNAPPAHDRLIGRIPVRNIWLLLLYASDLYRRLPTSSRTGIEDAPDEIPDLTARLLTYAVERRLRRNLTIGYRRREADLNRIRGRIDLLRTERRQLLARGRVACSFDELTVDTPKNRYVKAALLKLAGIVRNVELSRECGILATNMELAGVGDMLSQRTYSRRVPLDATGRLGSEDRQMLAAARLAFELTMPTEEDWGSEFAAPDRQEGMVRRLFEAAVGGFYRVELTRHGWRVATGRRIDFPVEGETSGLKAVFPSMKTDIELELYPRGTAAKRIVIDTKFTSIVKPGFHREETLSSEYIYQIYAYVRSQENPCDQKTMSSTAVLLHPAIDADFDESVIIQGHLFRFLTVNLAADSQTIREHLLRVISP